MAFLLFVALAIFVEIGGYFTLDWPGMGTIWWRWLLFMLLLYKSFERMVFVLLVGPPIEWLLGKVYIPLGNVLVSMFSFRGHSPNDE